MSLREEVGPSTIGLTGHSKDMHALATLSNSVRLAIKSCCYCHGIFESILEHRRCMCVYIYKHSSQKAPQGAQSRRQGTYVSTGSSRRCKHIFLPKLPLNYLQEPLPSSGCTRYAERSERGRGKAGSSICGPGHDIIGSVLAKSAL